MEKLEKQFKDCDICYSKATCLCFKCNNYFCERCFKLIHDVKNDPTHKKESIDPFIPIELKCPIHPQDRMNLFCVNENGKYIDLDKYLSLELYRNMLFIMLY